MREYQCFQICKLLFRNFDCSKARIVLRSYYGLQERIKKISSKKTLGQNSPESVKQDLYKIGAWTI